MHPLLALLTLVASVITPLPSPLSSAEPAPVRVFYRPPAPGPIIRHYEPPPSPYAAGHRGIDIAAPSGATVQAAADGRVAFAGPVGGSVAVSIDHEDGLRTTYSYLRTSLVRAGSFVQRGDPIARSGDGHPGSPAEPHLHFGIRRGDSYLDVEAIIVASLRDDHAGVLRLASPPG